MFVRVIIILCSTVHVAVATILRNFAAVENLFGHYVLLAEPDPENSI